MGPMNYQRQPQLRPLPPPRGALQARRDVIEWEDMPSLHERVRRSEFGPSASPAWNATRPIGLWEAPPPTPFREVLHGLHVREIDEDEVFQHFFGGR